ncbi:hypothetical protein HMPREF3227_01968 [Corynebacterium sp. CMW7794]|uniref:Zinc-binding dehydrogenase n=1 Tax=Corynebacterium phoceense TaxID=1686286 RepID=A0A540RAD3_9CORY|nr:MULTISPECIES: hypothetical protein [Corynebacterium]KXB53070.1 hypothetical protein HMPREF0307_01988 [Corynebacterium sp. DNF00584]KXI16501.1 hypothetical protein HMPREF3227_01968 [Corynebacterium sp. CMW7794]MBF9010736.1 zinc-binding dehydrogenase [Corynebacterium phoceense]MCQ9330587.1 zinc-binding dehydrogenase [Corynebacterium phoceense]MCQ9340343.1 zinc-binding dehydrogenase [Corynebacterium phoceense]
MLIAALVLALVAFVALVYYISTGTLAALVGLFVAAGLGLILFTADWVKKHRQDRVRIVDHAEPTARDVAEGDK